jgi:hypothetical protein
MSTNRKDKGILEIWFCDALNCFLENNASVIHKRQDIKHLPTDIFQSLKKCYSTSRKGKDQPKKSCSYNFNHGAFRVFVHNTVVHCCVWMRQVLFIGNVWGNLCKLPALWMAAGWSEDTSERWRRDEIRQWYIRTCRICRPIVAFPRRWSTPTTAELEVWNVKFVVINSTTILSLLLKYNKRKIIK